MAGKKRVEILYGPNGEVVVEAIGFKGKSCKEATKFLEEALGTEIDVKQKIEWHLTNSERIRRTRIHGVGNPSNLCG